MTQKRLLDAVLAPKAPFHLGLRSRPSVLRIVSCHREEDCTKRHDVEEDCQCIRPFRYYAFVSSRSG
jgi:hypothetical protein